jgi:uncharacterized RDD family membrane protein YckC
VQFEDRITIATPEGVHLELTLAGVGSRFAAALVDVAIQIALLIVIAAVGFGVFAPTGVGVAAVTILSFLVFAAYDILFEVFASGRTPGKRLNGLRVVRTDGSPVGFFTSAVRNVLRLVDLLPGMYFAGIVSILVTRRNQRLGDLAAGTLVVRERRPSLGWQAPAPAPSAQAADPQWLSWDVGAVTAAELAAIRRFLERRESLTLGARNELALKLAQPLRSKVPGVPEDVRGEPFLEQLAAAKAARS